MDGKENVDVPVQDTQEQEKHQRDQNKHRVKHSLLLRFVIVVVKFLTLPFWPIGNKVAKDGNTVWVTGQNKLLFAWPIVPGGLLMAALAEAELVSTGVMGWIALISLIVMLLTFAEDINVVRAIVIGLIVSLFFACAELVHIKMDLPVIHQIGGFLAGLDVHLDPGFAKAGAVLMALIFALYSLPLAYLNGRHELTSRSIEQKIVGRKSSDMVSASGLTMAVEWPDVLEFILGLGAGSIIFRNRGSKRVVKRIDHVFFLWFIHSYIEALYQSVATRTDELEELPPLDDEE